jgi:hypothetical protein
MNGFRRVCTRASLLKDSLDKILNFLQVDKCKGQVSLWMLLTDLSMEVNPKLMTLSRAKSSEGIKVSEHP